MKINEDFRDDDFDDYEPRYYGPKHRESDPEETNPNDCQDEAYEYAKRVCNDVIKSQKNFLDENNLEILDTDIDWDFRGWGSIPREFTLLFYVARKDEDDDRVEDITCELELSGEFIGREWQEYYEATYDEPEEGGYFEYVDYDEDPSDLKDVIYNFVSQVNKKFNSVDECFESLEEGEDTNKYEEIAKRMFSFYKDYDPYGYDDAFGGLTGVNEDDAINDTITSLVYDPQNTLDELEEIKKDLEISLEDGENDTDRNYLRTVNDLIDTINALPNLNEAMFGPYKYRYEVHYVGDRDYLLGGSRDIGRAIDIACNQLENVASNPWENSAKKRKLINSLYILDTEQNEKVDSDDLTAYKKEVLDVLGESLKESEIEFDDDLVVVISPNGQTIYKGIEDYEPMKDENWKYDYDCDCYRFEGYTKYKIDESLTEDWDDDEDKYTLVGVDGNAYSIMGYTANALKREGLRNLIKEMYDDATSSDYDHLLAVCLKYVDMANAAARGEDLDESVDKNPVKWEIIRKHKVQKPIDAFDFVDYISDEEVLETTDPMTRREAEKYAKKKYGSAKSKSGSGIHKVFVESEMNESAETNKLYKAISDTADAIDDLTANDREEAKKELTSASTNIDDVKDNLTESEDGVHTYNFYAYGGIGAPEMELIDTCEAVSEDDAINKFMDMGYNVDYGFVSCKDCEQEQPDEVELWPEE